MMLPSSAAAAVGITSRVRRVAPPPPSGGGGVPSWVTALPLWQWYAIPNTALSSVAPSPTPIGVYGPAAKIDAWCGATLKRSGSVYMLGACGGHTDYAGNEVNALALMTETPQWVQLRGPTPNANVWDVAQFYQDKRPAATHTYSATQFVGSQNRMLVMPSPGLGGIGPAPGGGAVLGDDRIFVFKLDENDWMLHDDPSYPALFTSGVGDFTACLVAQHQITEDIYYSRSMGDGWYRYRPSNNTWTKLSNTARAPWYTAQAIDPVRNRMLVVGGYDPGINPTVFDLSGNTISASFGGLGAGALQLQGHPGMVFDEVNDCYLIFYNSGGSIACRRVNASTWSVDAPSISGSIAARPNGIHNAIQYVPELKGVVIANSYTGNVRFMRTAA